VAFLFFFARPNAASVVAALYGLALITSHDDRDRRGIGWSSALFVALVLALSASNKVRFDRFTPLPAKGGYNLYVGNNPRARQYLRGLDFSYDDTAFQDIVKLSPLNRTASDGRGWYEIDAINASRAWRFMKANPGEIVSLGWL